jgi:sulfhydrogenase subunit beta (sulfur reductase)
VVGAAHRDDDLPMRLLAAEGLGALLAELARRGYDLVGPQIRDGAVVFDRIDGVADLPRGVVDEQGPGSYRLTEGAGPTLFGATCGPESAKRFLFPPRETTATVRRHNGHLDIEDAAPHDRPVAIVGLRSCDLHAVAVQDRVLLTGQADPSYRARREAAFLVGVDCARAGATCFCASMQTGPACTTGFDLALTELDGGTFLARAGTAPGEEVLRSLPTRAATAAEEVEADRQRERTEASMARQVDTGGIRDLLYRNLEHPRWNEVAEACLACGNCTSVCPTCFCTDVVDAATLQGDVAERRREWASCFTLEFSHLAGHDVRSSVGARYRQWLTHKFAGWIDQFGTSGCVGCGRCITWCPVGIDVTAELAAIRSRDGESKT